MSKLVADSTDFAVFIGRSSFLLSVRLFRVFQSDVEALKVMLLRDKAVLFCCSEIALETDFLTPLLQLIVKLLLIVLVSCLESEFLNEALSNFLGSFWMKLLKPLLIFCFLKPALQMALLEEDKTFIMTFNLKENKLVEMSINSKII